MGKNGAEAELWGGNASWKDRSRSVASQKNWEAHGCICGGCRGFVNWGNHVSDNVSELSLAVELKGLGCGMKGLHAG